MGRLTLCICVLAIVCCFYQNVSATQGRSVTTITFRVFHRDTYKLGQEILPTTASVNTFRNFRSKTVVIVHDYITDGQASRFHATLKHAFLTNEDVSVLMVDWGLIAAAGLQTAVAQAQAIGEHIATLIRLLVGRNQVNLSQLHLVGFGVGAHIVGFTSTTLNRAGRITALDPIAWMSGALSASVANYVEVIHTDIPTNTEPDAVGTELFLGEVDFYPNGGHAHPGCGTDHECRHNRAWQFLAASLTDGELVGSNCPPTGNFGVLPSDVTLDNCNGYTIALGGNDMVKFADGAFYAVTSGTYPFKENCIHTCSAPFP